ncbi:hypothetical protein PHLGIDRAFT_27915 [Phlebiopsis gigantea 11061_1 CR5-6]|uniref:Uncharacterized protein n=1 Tax=Phlebiopsis gigantea (strain 11061_1 CR5-6) TaxID=745531 RepID=A0A0C3PUQ3_PHLG1|nr:hypothetical protein PHLGIDRAFT_27915 [Phlebiopsis gigantea 11061_1 CR5-6]
MIMTSTHDIDAEKQRYASELADYTRRQWAMARQSFDQNQPQSKDRSSPKDGRSPTRGSQSSAESRTSQGIQSHDYGHRSHMRGGSIAHENRAVAA